MIAGDGHEVVARLRAAGCVAAEEEAALLTAAAPDRSTLDAWLARRESGEPLAWVTGTTTFCDRLVHVAPGVYVPRPHTEELARRAAAELPARGRALDLCAGTGAIAAHLQSTAPGATVIAVDVDPLAAACARRNRVAAIVGDLAAPVRAHAFDVITAVTPYVPTDALHLLPADVVRHEPRRALDGGDDGLAVARRVVEQASTRLRAGGWLFLEVGGDQDERLAAALTTQGFVAVEPWRDDDGDVRGVAARRAPS